MRPNAVCRTCNGQGCDGCVNGRVWCTLNCPVQSVGSLGEQACQRCMWQRGPDPELQVAAAAALHYRTGNVPGEPEADAEFCFGCSYSYPCPTARALGVTESSTHGSAGETT